MPEEIVKRCVRMFTYVDDIVLDPFTGSGTTLKVAKELGRKYIGYEIYEHYSGVINEKLLGEAQWSLFTNVSNAPSRTKSTQ